MCDEIVWAHQTEALADIADMQVATNGARDSLVAMAEAIIAQAPARFAIAGHSMGGRVALEGHPARVRGAGDQRWRCSTPSAPTPGRR